MLSTRLSQIAWGVCFSISTSAFALKLYTRCRYLGGLKIDDYLIIVAQMFFTISTINIFIMLENGLQEKKEMWLFFPHGQVKRLLVCFWVSIETYLWGLLFIKLSLIALFRRTTRRAVTLAKLNHYLTFLSVTSVAYSIAIFVATFFWCTPIKAFWTPMPIVPLSPKYCSEHRQKMTIYVWQGFDLSTDVLILITPYFLIPRAALARKTQRFALAFCFGLGSLVIASSSIRAIGIARNFEPSSLIMWSFIEGSTAIVVACLPSLPPLIWHKKRENRVSIYPSGADKRSSRTEMRRIGAMDEYHQFGAGDDDTIEEPPPVPPKDTNISRIKETAMGRSLV